MALNFDNSFMDSLFLTLRQGFERHLEDVAMRFNSSNFDELVEHVYLEVELGDKGCGVQFDTALRSDGLLDVGIAINNVMQLRKD